MSESFVGEQMIEIGDLVKLKFYNHPQSPIGIVVKKQRAKKIRKIVYLTHWFDAGWLKRYPLDVWFIGDRLTKFNKIEKRRK